MGKETSSIGCNFPHDIAPGGVSERNSFCLSLLFPVKGNNGAVPGRALRTDFARYRKKVLKNGQCS